mgnify:CR=1 FL=1
MSDGNGCQIGESIGDETGFMGIPISSVGEWFWGVLLAASESALAIGHSCYWGEVVTFNDSPHLILRGFPSVYHTTLDFHVPRRNITIANTAKMDSQMVMAKNAPCAFKPVPNARAYAKGICIAQKQIRFSKVGVQVSPAPLKAAAITGYAAVAGTLCRVEDMLGVQRSSARA